MWHGKKSHDEDGVGYVENRSGLYVSGYASAVKNILMFLDDVWHFRLSYHDDVLDALAQLPELEVYTPADLPLSIDKDTDATHCVFQVYKGQDCGMSVLQVPPPVFPSRIVVLTVEPVTPEIVHFVCSGNTKPFQQEFVKATYKLGSADKKG